MAGAEQGRHTPGPWGLSKAIEVWVMAGPVHVATIPRAGDGDWSEDNARLIAAAPELLSMLQHMVRWHDQLSPSDIARAEAVIAMALATRAAAPAGGR